jgi:hypothetical protein
VHFYVAPALGETFVHAGEPWPDGLASLRETMKFAKELEREAVPGKNWALLVFL